MVVIAALALVAGLITGYVLPALLAAAFGYLAWHLVQIHRVEHWLRTGEVSGPEEIRGIWGEIYREIFRLRWRSRRRKRKLSKFLRRFRESTAAMPDGTVVLGANGRIEWFNEAAARMLGLAPGDAGQRIANLVRHPAFTEYIGRRDSDEWLDIPAPADGTQRISVRIVQYGKKNQRLLMVRDITRLHRLEQMRRDFVANVSHELRTPLTVVQGYVETLLDECKECPAQWKQSLQAMEQQTERMSHLIEDLLLLSRLETEEISPRDQDAVPIPELLASIQRDAEMLSAGRHTIETDIEPEIWLRGEEGLLRSAFSNLVTNALQYTPEGGRIILRWQPSDHGAQLQVQDTGLGIPENHIPRLTERFYRVDPGRSRDRGGTGLGLAIVKHVLHRHDATLEIESEVGTGSVFTCRFPPGRVVLPKLTPGDNVVHLHS